MSFKLRSLAESNESRLLFVEFINHKNFSQVYDFFELSKVHLFMIKDSAAVAKTRSNIDKYAIKTDVNILGKSKSDKYKARAFSANFLQKLIKFS